LDCPISDSAGVHYEASFTYVATAGLWVLLLWGRYDGGVLAFGRVGLLVTLRAGVDTWLLRKTEFSCSYILAVDKALNEMGCS